MHSAARHADNTFRNEAAARAARAAWAAAQPGTLHGAEPAFDDEDGDAIDPAEDGHDSPSPALQRLMVRLQRQPDFLATLAHVRRV
jgi:hypothetical protein